MTDLDLSNHDAAIFACRPIRLEDWPQEWQDYYNEAMAKSGMPIPTYDNAIVGQCQECGIDIQVGPRQQVQIRRCDEDGIPIIMLCLMDASLFEIQQMQANPASKATLYNLGNPQKS